MTDNVEFGFARPMLPPLGENRIQRNCSFSPNSMLIHAPGGDLDLSLYKFTPKSQLVQPSSSQQTNVKESSTEQESKRPHQQTSMTDSKKKRFKRPRRSSLLEKFVAFLEDKRVMEDSEDAHQLEDIKMPRLRNVLNIIFITAGVGFLLAVVIVIVYTTFVRWVLQVGEEKCLPIRNH